jgi:16S rRNA (guanine527-N7)-methyltransferase
LNETPAHPASPDELAPAPEHERPGERADKAAASPPAATSLDDFAAALARHSLVIPPDQIAQLDRYRQLLWEWNEKMNLTRHTDLDRFVSRDIVDSWQLAQLLAPSETVLDFGTGGGVPGIVVAILRPDVRVAVCDSVGKKAKAVESMIGKLKLGVPVFAERVEAVLARRRFHTLMARAVGSLSDVLRWIGPGWKSVGRLLLVKGPRWVEERGEARHRGLMHGLALRIAATYPMPGTDANSVILKLWRDPRGDSNRPGDDRAGSDRAGSDRAGSDRGGSDRGGSEAGDDDAD